MADVPLALLVHRVTVETYTGDSGFEKSYAPAVPNVPCLVDGQVVLQPDGTLADPVRLYCRLDRAQTVTVDSRVVLPGDRVAYVQAVQRRDDGNLGAWQHLEAALR